MKSLFATLLTASLAGASPLSTEPRQVSCGVDLFGYDAYCADGYVCCEGSFIYSCMPEGYSCCETGYYCLTNDSCWLDNDTLETICQSEDDPEATSVAETPDTFPTSDPNDDTPSGSDDDGDDDVDITDAADDVIDEIDDVINGDDDEDAAVDLDVGSLYLLTGVFGTAMLII